MRSNRKGLKVVMGFRSGWQNVRRQRRQTDSWPWELQENREHGIVCKDTLYRKEKQGEKQ